MDRKLLDILESICGKTKSRAELKRLIGAGAIEIHVQEDWGRCVYTFTSPRVIIDTSVMPKKVTIKIGKKDWYKLDL